jgi:hypothetical protein
MTESQHGARRWACEGPMIVLRCTQRLLRASKVEPVADSPEPTVALGEWYANVVSLPFRGRTLVVFVHSGTLLSVAAPGRVLRTTVPVFQQRLPLLLARLDLPRPWVDAQAAALSSVQLARTASRSVLGSMNDIVGHIHAEAEDVLSPDHLNLDRLEDRLAGVIFGALGYQSPLDVLRELARSVVRERPAGPAKGL